jgi:hypothetical protein
MPIGFWNAWWDDVKPELRAQLRDTTVQSAALGSVAILHLFTRALSLIGVDNALLEVLSFIDKWATVGTFGMMVLGILSRSLRSLSRSIWH